MKTRAKRRVSERGAVFVEAIIVVAFFILAFCGLLFFHGLHVSKLRVSRLARAATLHYAIVGCQGDINGELAAVGGASTTPGAVAGNNVSYGQQPTSGMSSSAQSAVGSQSGISSLGAQIVHITSDGHAGAHGGGASFHSKTNTTSWVGCSDKVSDDQYTPDLLTRVESAIKL